MAQAKIVKLGGADSWVHPTTKRAYQVGDLVELDKAVEALVSDGWAALVGAVKQAADVKPAPGDLPKAVSVSEPAKDEPPAENKQAPPKKAAKDNA